MTFIETDSFYLTYTRQYLDSQRGTTLWGQAYDITDDARREQAAQWLAAQLTAVSDMMVAGIDTRGTS